MNKGGAIGRLARLKCMMKRWQNQTKTQQLHQHLLDDDGDCHNAIDAYAPSLNDKRLVNVPAEDMHTVLVGKTRRKYMITSQVAYHPLFRILVQRSSLKLSGGQNVDCYSDQHTDKSEIVVCCEVVLFEHLLWMLENADTSSDSVDELVDFYAC
ncbi:SAUR-like auxin-responsive protein family [Zostera marina]|uniref:SAUR-like auxin-responsive protein family n=1 Tax=Zostera marina TaxID=29655 RepID=A0A0K9NM01_ZOSMR|nr:SAUR-like auxin-responsive protein family [Zostera marina]